MNKTLRLVTLLLALALMVGAFAGCGNSAASTSEVASEASEASETTSAAAADTAAAEDTTPAEAVDSAAAPAASAAEEAPVDTSATAEHVTIAEAAPDVEMELPLTTDDVHFEYFTTLNPQITGYMSDLSENLYYQTAQELTGVTIDFVLASPDTQSENFQLMIAGGDYTDLIGSEGANYTGGVELAVNDEVYLNINDYKDYAPNYYALLDSGKYDMSTMLTDSGYMAGFGILYTEDQPLNQGYMVRQDWLDALGLDTPTTYDQWHDVLTAFKDEYDCTPLALTGFNLSGLSAGYGVYGDVSSSTVPVYVDSDEVKFAWTQDSYKDYLTMLNEWYNEGLIDPDELINTAPFPDEDKIITDQRGMWKVERDNMVYYQGIASNPDFRAVAVQYPSMNEGETTHFKELTPNCATPALYLTTDCENPELLVSWVDFRYSEQGATLANYGVEGITFEYDENGVPAFTEEVTANPEGMTVSLAMNVYTLWRCECLYDAYRLNSTFSQDQRDAPQIWATNSDTEMTMPSVSLTADEGEEAASIYSDIYTYASEHITKFITGDESLDTYDEFVATIEGMDTDRLVEIYQDAYDRYIGR